MGDRLVVMNEGIIEQVGTAHEIFTNPKTFFVASFVGDNFILKGEISSVDGTLVTIQTERGVFKVDSKRELPKRGETAGFSVRADLISVLSESGGSFANQLHGEVDFVEYVGYVVRLRIKLDWGDEIMVKETEDVYFQRPYEEGEKVTVGWAAKDAVFLSEP
jgi:ABC-type Fe3+/spermidine/putrescine transport system ATPase subunit